jgi:hypothetical protein
MPSHTPANSSSRWCHACGVCVCVCVCVCCWGVCVYACVCVCWVKERTPSSRWWCHACCYGVGHVGLDRPPPLPIHPSITPPPQPRRHSWRHRPDKNRQTRHTTASFSSNSLMYVHTLTRGRLDVQLYSSVGSTAPPHPPPHIPRKDTDQTKTDKRDRTNSFFP